MNRVLSYRIVSYRIVSCRIVSQLKTGVVQSECSGSMVVPTDGGLVKGQAYYARVFAYSPVGFSPSQVGLNEVTDEPFQSTLPSLHSVPSRSPCVRGLQ